MHQLERIALWVIVAVLVFFTFFRQASGFAATDFNIMSLAEFSKIPVDIKNAYAQALTNISNAFSTKLANEWNSMTSQQKQQKTTQINTVATTMAARIATLPPLLNMLPGGSPAPVSSTGAMPPPSTGSIPTPMPSPSTASAGLRTTPIM